MKKIYKFECNKLVRDLTINRSKQFDYKMDYKFIDGKEYIDAIRTKIIDENK